ncbi:MAG: hypothetical protein VXY15_04770 [Bacteroidota bacterium]|nr:hypothetical protein [Bacteroidota bacterium]
MRKIRSKSCQRCQKTEDIMFRVVYQKNLGWQFLCKRCVLEVKGNASYKYGGTWKR